MVFLFQNMIILVLFHQICAPKHGQVKLSVRVLNVWLGSDSIQPVIKNTINSWYYMNLFLTELNTRCAKVYHVISHYPSHGWRIYSLLNKVGSRYQNFIDTTKIPSKVLLLCSFTNISISPPWLTKYANACQQQDRFIQHGSYIFFTS